MKIWDLGSSRSAPPPPPEPTQAQQRALVKPLPPPPPADAFERPARGRAEARIASVADGSILPPGLGVEARLDGKARAAFRRALETGAPVAARDLPPRLLAALERELPERLRGLVDAPHAGFRFGVFDFARLGQASAPAVAAINAFLDPGFVRGAPDDKARVLDAIAPVLLPGAAEALRAFHLPRAFEGGAPLTYSFEAESGLARRPEILRYYAPHPSGALDPRALTPAFLDRVQPRGRKGEIWARMDHAHRREALTWTDLSLDERQDYLRVLKEEVDPKVSLHRVRDPRLVGEGRAPLADTVSDRLVWEGTPLHCAEVITADCYASLDVLFDDVRSVAEIAETQPGYHIHHVAELSGPEAVKRLGPKLTGLAGLEDLRIFCRGVRRGSNLLTHTHLEVWRSEDLEEVARSFAGGAIDPDAVDIHKFHCVGMREGIYGQEGRLGLELRAVRVGENLELARVSQRMADTLAKSERLEAVPAPPWGDFDSGRKGRAAEAFADAKAEQPFFHDAEISFDEIFRRAAGAHPDRDAWKLAAPFWRFESLPGMKEADAGRVREAREVFVFELLTLSQDLTELRDAGREMPPAEIERAVRKALARFFASSKVDEQIDRTLDRISGGRAP